VLRAFTAVAGSASSSFDAPKLEGSGGGGFGLPSPLSPSTSAKTAPRDPVLRLILSNGGRATVYRDEVEGHLQALLACQAGGASKQQPAAELKAAAAAPGGGPSCSSSADPGTCGFWVDLVDREEEESQLAASFALSDRSSTRSGGGLPVPLKREKGAVMLAFERLADDDGSDEGVVLLSTRAAAGGVGGCGGGGGGGGGDGDDSPDVPLSALQWASAAVAEGSGLAADLFVVGAPWALRLCFVASAARLAFLAVGQLLLPNSSPSVRARGAERVP
jgi:hypothetical protein